MNFSKITSIICLLVFSQNLFAQIKLTIREPNCFTVIQDRIVSNQKICAGNELSFIRRSHIRGSKPSLPAPSLHRISHRWVLSKDNVFQEEKKVKGGIRLKFQDAGEYEIISETKSSCGGIIRNIDKVTVYPNPDITIEVVDPIICKGKYSKITASGASTYIWDTPLQDQTAVVYVNPESTTTYSVIGTSSEGCSSSASIEIAVEEIDLDAGTYPVSCPLKPVTLTANANGSPSFDYKWHELSSDGTYNIRTSTQTLVVYPEVTTSYMATATSENGCIIQEPVTIIVESTYSITASADETICSGDAVTLSATLIATWYEEDMEQGGFNVIGSGGGAITVSPTQTTNYYATHFGIDECYSEDLVTVTVEEPEATCSLSWSETDQSFCYHVDVVSCANQDYLYSWSDSKMMWSTAEKDLCYDNFKAVAPYYVDVMIQDLNGNNIMSCHTDGNIYSARKRDDLPLSKVTESFIGVFPNPAHDEITLALEGNTNNGIIDLKTITGQTLKSLIVNQEHWRQEIKFNISEVPAGAYFLLYTSADSKVILHEKLIVY